MFPTPLLFYETQYESIIEVSFEASFGLSGELVIFQISIAGQLHLCFTEPEKVKIICQSMHKKHDIEVNS